MAVVTLPYAPSDGSVLNPDELMRNYHSSVDGESLYGELDGHLQDANFVGGFRIRPEHIRPGETARLHEEVATEALDYYDDLWPSSDDGIQDQYVPVAGAACRMYIPYDCAAVFYNVSCFYTVFRVRQRKSVTDFTYVRTAPNITIALYIDGVRLDYTQRECPITYYPRYNGGGAQPQAGDACSLLNTENIQTQHWDINHLAISNGSDSSRTQVGYHTVVLKLFMPKNTGQEYMQAPYGPVPKNNHDDGTAPDDDKRYLYNMNHRFRCGIRSARIVALP